MDCVPRTVTGVLSWLLTCLIWSCGSDIGIASEDDCSGVTDIASEFKDPDLEFTSLVPAEPLCNVWLVLPTLAF